jgi:hypothetical protein
MSDDRPADVLGALPRRRPHRRSQKRGALGEAPATAPAKAAAKATTKAPAKATAIEGASAARKARAERLRQPAQPAGTPTAPRVRAPAPPSGPEILGTAVNAVAELAEIGLTASARALRGALARLPRP